MVTIIDYEKAYKEALNRAKLLKYNPKKVLFECENIPISDYIFPELKESEDERIRKAIHIYLDWLDGRKDYQPKGEYTIRDMIAWIEKQGEMSKMCPASVQDKL